MPSATDAFDHVTVLRSETVALLAPAPGKLIVDGTLGGGGHTEALLEAGADVVGLDQDETALAAASARLARFGPKFRAVRSNFRRIADVVRSLGVEGVDGVLVDLGVSSPQLDVAERGFSFMRPGPLDMRMDRSTGVPLSEWLAGTGERELARVISEYGEENFARPIARAIVAAHATGTLTDTAALAAVVSAAVPRKAWPKTLHPATRTFQGLRIAVNDELGALGDWLAALPAVVKPGGRACAIAFHSLEDRPVKQAFAALATGCTCPPDLPMCACGKTAAWRLLTRKAVQASEEETRENPRARSARLRGVERLPLKI